MGDRADGKAGKAEATTPWRATSRDDQSSAAASFHEVMHDETERGAELRGNWRTSPERRKITTNAIAFSVSAIVISMVTALLAYLFAPDSSDQGFAAMLWGGGSALVLGYLGGILFLLLLRRHRQAWFDRVVVLRARDDLVKAETDLAHDNLDLASLWSLTQKRLDYYHQIATSQSERSFAYGLGAAAVGLLVLIVSAVIAGIARSTTASIAAGLVGVGGGGLAAYIGSTFMKLQEATTVQLRAYFRQPLEFSRYLAAERLLENVDAEHRSQATRELMRALTRTEAGDEVGQPVSGQSATNRSSARSASPSPAV